LTYNLEKLRKVSGVIWNFPVTTESLVDSGVTWFLSYVGLTLMKQCVCGCDREPNYGGRYTLLVFSLAILSPCSSTLRSHTLEKESMKSCPTCSARFMVYIFFRLVCKVNLKKMETVTPNQMTSVLDGFSCSRLVFWTLITNEWRRCIAVD
jgi:hypothetical protein